MLKMAQQDPQKVFTALTAKMKDIEGKMNNVQASVQERQGWNQQYKEIKNTFDQILQNLTASGQFQPGKLGGENNAVQQRQPVAPQQQQQLHYQQQQQQGRPPNAQAGPSNTFQGRPTNGQTFAATPARPTQQMGGAMANASPGHFGSPMQPAPSIDQQQSTPRMGGATSGAFPQQPAVRPPPPQGAAQPQWPVGQQQMQQQQQLPQQLPRPSQLPATSPLNLKQEQFTKALGDILPRHGINLSQPVFVGGQQIDLWTLYQVVAERGGMATVSQSSAWPNVVVAIGLAKHGSPEAYTLAQPLAETYQSYLFAFEGVWQRAVQSLMVQQAAKLQAQQSQMSQIPQSAQTTQGNQAFQQQQQQQAARMQQMPGAMQQQRPMMPQNLQQQQQQQMQQQAHAIRIAQQQMAPGQHTSDFQNQGAQMQPPQQRPPQMHQQSQSQSHSQQQQQSQAGNVPSVKPGPDVNGPVPHVTPQQLQQFGLTQEKFAELWRSGTLQRNAANNQQRQQQMQQNVQAGGPPPPQQGAPQGSQPFAPPQASSSAPQLSQTQPPPQGEARQMPITREKYEDAKEQLRKVDEELMNRRPDLKAPRQFTDEERSHMTAFVKDLCEVCDHCNVLLPAFFAMNGAPLESSGAKRAKIMLWMMRDQVAAMRRGESTMSMEDLRKMAHHFQRIISFVKSSNVNVYEHLLKEYRDGRAVGAPSFILGETYTDGDVKRRQAQELAQQQSQQSNSQPQPQQVPQGDSQGQQSRPQVNLAGALPVDEATAAQMGIKRGLRVDDLKLPPTKRGKGAATPGTPTNNASSPPAAATDLSPAPGTSPKLGAASPQSARGGKRGQPAARGRAKKGKAAATPTSGTAKGEDSSPKAKPKTSADIMAEVKAEMAAEEGKKRKAEANRAAAGIEDPSKNPILIADAESIAARDQRQALSESDPLAFLGNSWQALLDTGNKNPSHQPNGTSSAAGPPSDDPLKSILAAVSMSPSAALNNSTSGPPDAAGASASVTANVETSAVEDNFTNEADNFFDFDLFDYTSGGPQQDEQGGNGAEQSAKEPDQGQGLESTAKSEGDDNEDDSGLPFIPSSDDVPAETPELGSSSGVPSAASSSTSSSLVLPKVIGNLPRPPFDEAGFWAPPGSASPEAKGDTPEDTEHLVSTGGKDSSEDKGLSKGKVTTSADPGDSNDTDATSWWEADHSVLYNQQEKPWAIV